jgi:hypothetical protein
MAAEFTRKEALQLGKAVEAGESSIDRWLPEFVLGGRLDQLGSGIYKVQVAFREGSKRTHNILVLIKKAAVPNCRV